MRLTAKTLTATFLVAVGYVLGTSGFLKPATVRAQPAVGGSGPTKEALDKIVNAYNALQVAQQALVQEQLYKPAITGINPFAVAVGGLDAMRDLQEGRGVDPMTFAGLYADKANDEVAKLLKTDAKGRLTYDNKVVKMYSIERLKDLYIKRDQLQGKNLKR